MRSALTTFVALVVFGMVTPGHAQSSDQAPAWRAVLAAGDDSTPVFDNAVQRLSTLLAARGVGPIDRFTTDPMLARAALPIATVQSMTDALAGARQPGRACLLFITSHGEPNGMLVRDDDASRQVLDPSTLARLLDDGCGGSPTVAIVSGCYSGIFIGAVTEAPNRIILTAARDDRTSFGCGHEETYTYYDDCLFRSWPDSKTWLALYRATDACVHEKENRLGVPLHSEPQAYFGAQVANLALP